jgi:hypothetical protein
MTNENDYPDHICGKVMEYCIFNETKIYFCSYCRKVSSASINPEENVKITIFLTDEFKDKKQNEYDEDNRKQWI